MTHSEFGQLANNANVVKDLVLTQLMIDGKISPEDREEYTTNWGVITLKKNWFNKWFDTFYKTKHDDDYIFKFFKLTTIETPLSEDSEDEFPDPDEDLSSWTDSDLIIMLDLAIEKENYSLASEIRDEQKKRNTQQ